MSPPLPIDRWNQVINRWWNTKDGFLEDSDVAYALEHDDLVADCISDLRDAGNDLVYELQKLSLTLKIERTADVDRHRHRLAALNSFVCFLRCIHSGKFEEAECEISWCEYCCDEVIQFR